LEHQASGAFTAMIFAIPYAVVATGMALSWRFNRSKIFFILLSLAMGYWAIGGLIGAGSLFHAIRFDSRFLHAVLSILLPLNILVFSLIRERGIFTSRGVSRFGFVLAQILVVYILWAYVGDRAVSWLQVGLWPAVPGLATRLTDISIVLMAATLLLLIYRITSLHSSLDYGLIIVVLIIAYMLHKWDKAMLMWQVTGAAGVLVVALVQDAYRKAYVDELTGLPGRRSMEEYFLKLSGMYTVAMVDIDHFKKCNDRYGHDVGDQVLRMIASFLARVERGGKAFRYGGEEFAIVFPGKQIDDVMSALDILRQSIADNRFVIRSFFRSPSKPDVPPKRENQKRLGVTVSIGCASYTREDHLPADVIKRADKALYRAKETGRNRVCRA